MKTTFTAIFVMLLTNLICSRQAGAQIIKGVEDNPQPQQPVRWRPVKRDVTVRTEEVPEPEEKPATPKPAVKQVEKTAEVKAEAGSKVEDPAKAKADKPIDFIVQLQLRNTTYGSSLMSGLNPLANVNTTAANKDTVSNDFRMRRLRFGVAGKIDKVWVYKLLINAGQLVGNGTANPDNGIATVSSGVQEAFVGWAPAQAFTFRIGSTKTPFARENLTSAMSLTTLERGLGVSNIGRLFDTGALVSGKFADGRLHYGLGVFNGNGGFSNSVNADIGGTSLASGRIQIDPLGEYKNGEVYFSEKFLISLGFAGSYEKNRSGANIGSPLPAGVTNDIVSVTADLGINFWRVNIEANYLTAYSPANGYAFGAVQGYAGTVAFWVISQAMQAVFRYESYLNATTAVPVAVTTVTNAANAVVETRSASAADAREKRFITVGFNFYFSEKHRVKLQAFYHYGLNRYYTTDVQANALGGVTKITNSTGDFEHADDWAAIQAQMAL